MQSVYIVGKHAPYIGPAGAATQEIELFVISKIIDDGMLIYSTGVTAGCFGRFHIRDTGNSGPHTPGSAVGRGKTPVKENALPAHAVKERCGIQRISKHGTFVSAERFTDHQHHIGFCSKSALPGLNSAGKTQ